jgi:hypothetical protein
MSIVAHGLTSTEGYVLLAVSLWLLGWACSFLAGFVAMFACSPRMPGARRTRRILAVANLVFTAGAVSAVAVMGELVDSGVLYAGHVSIAVACILGIPTFLRQDPVIDDSVDDPPGDP